MDFNLSAWALRHQALVRYFMALLLVGGLLAYFTLGRLEDPEFTMKTMVVKVLWPGATAQEMELQVTDKLEKKLQETPNLDVIRSYSKPGEATLFVDLRESVSAAQADDAWYQVRKKTGDMAGELPQGVLGPFFNDEFGDTFGSIYAFTADGFGYAQLKDYVDRVRQELLRLDSVSKVDVIGAQEERIYIEMSDKKLSALEINPVQIFDALEAQNSMESAGRVDTGDARIFLRPSGDFDSVESIRDIGIQANGRIFRLGDIAEVRRGYEDPPTFKMRYQGQEAIGLAVSMTQDGDIIALGENLDSTLARLLTQLPMGIEVHKVADQPQVVRLSVNEFMKVLIEALVIVLLVSFFSLGLRTGLVVALCIPLVLAATFLIMKATGIQLQRISLGALIIALGLLVDDAIIAVEMMALKLEQGWERFKAATYAYSTTAFPMLTGTLIATSGFLPIGLAKSNAGEYTFSIFAVVGISLLVSWVVAVVFAPYLGYVLLPRQVAHGDEQAVYQKPFYRRFRRLLEWCLDWRWLVILATLLALAGAVGAFRYVPQQFFPASERPELLVDLWLPEGSSFAATGDQVQRLETILAQDPDIDYIVAYVGGGSPRFYLPMDLQLMNQNFAQLMLVTKGEAARERVLRRLRDLFESDFPLVRGRVQRLENGPPVGYPVQFRVVGEDPQRLREIAGQVAVVMRANPHTRDVHNNWNEAITSLRLDIDQDKVRALGLSTQAVAQNLNAILHGLTATQYREGDKLIDVVIRARPEERGNLGDVDDLAVFSPDGRAVPVGQLARLEPVFEEGIIWRRNRFPAITVRADIPDGVQAPDVTRQIDQELAALRAALPDGYRIQIGGAEESSAKSEASIAAGMPLMVGIMLTLLMFQLQSFSRTLLVVLTAPLGMIGVSLFLLLFQQPFGFVAMLGVISLAGMIMRNSVILVDQIQQDVAEGSAPWEAIVESTVRRFRPIVLTAAAAILAMIPLTQSVFWKPMAVAIMGGLLVATVLTLLFLPALYAAWFRVRRVSHEPLAVGVGVRE